MLVADDLAHLVKEMVVDGAEWWATALSLCGVVRLKMRGGLGEEELEAF